ncbi:MAG: peptidase [Proteobacteria bacterium]|nr:peptidase [Pseudomonadota bacterium]
MIKSFRHKGLKKLFTSGEHSGINPRHAPKITRILDRLDASTNPSDMNLPGYKLRELSGKMKGIWVNGNWRITFEFESADATSVDYQDYH